MSAKEFELFYLLIKPRAGIVPTPSAVFLIKFLLEFFIILNIVFLDK